MARYFWIIVRNRDQFVCCFVWLNQYWAIVTVPELPQGRTTRAKEHEPRNGFPMCHFTFDLTCKHGSVVQSEGLWIPMSPVQVWFRPENSNSYGFEVHHPSIEDTKLLFKVIKSIIIIMPLKTSFATDQATNGHFQNYQQRSSSNKNLKSSRVSLVWLLVLLTKIDTAYFQMFKSSQAVLGTNADGCRWHNGDTDVSNTK